MGARLTNFPSYVVYDRSFNATASVAWLPASLNPYTTTTGSISSVLDKNLATYYGVDTGNTGIKTTSETMTFDFGKQYWNCVINLRIYTNSRQQAYTALIQYSTDNSTWTTFATNTSGTTANYSGNILTARYIRIYNQDNSTGTNNFGATINVYELRLLGSD